MNTPLSNSINTLPWEDGQSTAEMPIWRYSKNPIINRNPFPNAAKVYNSAVVYKDGAYVGVFRADYRTGIPTLHTGRSENGIRWEFSKEPIPLKTIPDATTHDYGYDPRVVLLEGSYYVTWCNGYHGPTIGIAKTSDFEQFEQLENAFLPCNRNGVLFPRKINGKYALLSRPSDKGHTPFGDIFYSESPDLCHWGKHRFVMGASGRGWWEDTKIGAGPTPIETPDGWLLIYHGVANSCSGFVYSIGIALLDLDEPWKVIRRGKTYALTPETEYEVSGFVPNVLFPCAALHDEATGRIALYYGSADTVTALAFTTTKALMDFLDVNG